MFPFARWCNRICTGRRILVPLSFVPLFSTILGQHQIVVASAAGAPARLGSISSSGDDDSDCPSEVVSESETLIFRTCNGQKFPTTIRPLSFPPRFGRVDGSAGGPIGPPGESRLPAVPTSLHPKQNEILNRPALILSSRLSHLQQCLAAPQNHLSSGLRPFVYLVCILCVPPALHVPSRVPLERGARPLARACAESPC